MIRHYLKITIRDIGKNKFRYLITTIGLAVGIAFFSLMHFVVDIPNKLASLPNEKDLYQMVSSTDEFNSRLGMPWDAFRNVQVESFSEIEELAIFSDYKSSTYTANSDNENIVFRTYMLRANRDFFSVTSADFIHGNINSWGDRKQAVITDNMAKKLFGEEYPIGKQIYIQSIWEEAIGSYTVTGVIKPIISEYYHSDIYLEWHNPEEGERKSVAALVKLKKGASPNEINKVLKSTTLNKGFENFRTYSDHENSYLNLINFNDNKNLVPIATRTILLMLAAVVLIAALFNFFNMLIISIQSRMRQLTLRKVVGANHRALFVMLLCEIIPILFFAFLISYSFIELFLLWIKNNLFLFEEFSNYSDFILPKLYHYPLTITGGTLLISILTAILLSYRIQKMVLVQGIRGKTIKRHRNLMRNALISLQILLTLIFLSSAIGISVAGLKELSDVHRTVSTAQSKAIFEFEFSGVYKLRGKSEELVSRIEQIPGVDMVMPSHGFIWEETMEFEQRFTGYERVNVHFLVEDYQQLFELETPLTPTSLAPDEIIVNEKFANYLNEHGATTYISGIYDKTYKIVGTVPQIPYTKTNSYAVIFPAGVSNYSSIIVKANPEKVNSVHKQLMLLIREYVPETIPFEITSLYESIKQGRVLVKSMMTAFLIAALLSLLLTVFGIFTIVNADTKLRQKEIAIRKINGATYRDVLWKYLKLYTITLIAVLIASIPFYLIAVKLLGFPLTNTYILMGILTISWIFVVKVVLLTVFNQIRKVAKTNPAEVLQAE